jgi:hypothetical protein
LNKNDISGASPGEANTSKAAFALSSFKGLSTSSNKLSGPSASGTVAKVEPANAKKTKKKKMPKVAKEKPKLTGMAYYLNKIENLYEDFMQVK